MPKELAQAPLRLAQASLEARAQVPAPQEGVKHAAQTTPANAVCQVTSEKSVAVVEQLVYTRVKIYKSEGNKCDSHKILYFFLVG